MDELDASAKKLKDRVSALLTGAKKYRDGLSAMHDAQLAFAAALTEFGGGTDEESLHLGERRLARALWASAKDTQWAHAMLPTWRWDKSLAWLWHGCVV